MTPQDAIDRWQANAARSINAELARLDAEWADKQRRYRRKTAAIRAVTWSALAVECSALVIAIMIRRWDMALTAAGVLGFVSAVLYWQYKSTARLLAELSPIDRSDTASEPDQLH